MIFRRRKREEPDRPGEEPQKKPEPVVVHVGQTQHTPPEQPKEPEPNPLPAEYRSDDGDVLTIISGRVSTGIKVVRLLARNERQENVVMVWTAGHAREVAAAIVASADLADGFAAPIAWPTTLAPRRRRFACDQSPGDTLDVRCVPEAGNRPACVVVSLHDGDHGRDVAIEVPSHTARRIAASILNAADYADGIEHPAAL